MIVEIDHKSGFCFGVVNVIQKAEEALKEGKRIYSLGQIVHNEEEIKRLQELGLLIIHHEDFFHMRDCTVLIRAHGEPPATYEYASKNNITIIEGTCPVVLKLQQRVKKASETMTKVDGQVVIFGHANHAEVVGLTGQTNNEAIIIEDSNDLGKIDPSRPMEIYSQTTMPVDQFNQLTAQLKAESKTNQVVSHDTICRQVANRIPHLQEFARKYDVVVFAGGKKSSNAQVLFSECKKQNTRSHFVTSPEELQSGWFKDTDRVGICGATSTPQWLMERIAEHIKQF